MPKHRIAMISVSVLILLIIVWYTNPYLLYSYLSKSDVRFIFLGLIASNIALVVRVLKWYVLLDGVKFTELMPIQFLGITISNFTPGKVAEPAKAIILKLKSNIPVSKTLPSVIWERIMDVIVLVLFSIIGIQLLGLRANFYLLGVLTVIAFLGLIALLLIILHSKKVGIAVFNFLRRFPILNKISGDFIHAFYENTIKKKKLFLCFSLTIIPWVLDGIVLYFAARAIGIEISPLICIGVIALSVLIGVASSLPGGLGSAEAVGILLLGLVGVGNVAGAAVIFLARFLGFWWSIFVGGASFIYLSKKINLKDVKM